MSPQSSRTHSPATYKATAAQWLAGARPHTWANAVAPVLAGTAAAVAQGQGDALRAVLAACVSLALIVGVNYANDYSDGIRGTDDDRSGPGRLTASGVVPPAAVKRAAMLSFAVAAVAGTVLSLISAWWLVLIGAACIAGAWFYTGGKNPYGYRGLGEVAVFVFFGLVAVLGTEFTQAGRVTWTGFLLAVAVGALSSSVNLVNNLRDIPTDGPAGKITLAVRLGDARTRALFTRLHITAGVSTALAGLFHPVLLLCLATGTLLVQAGKPVRSGARGAELIPVLGATGRAMLQGSAVALVVTLAYTLFQ